jgi:HD-like signal output (HDOD) protein
LFKSLRKRSRKAALRKALGDYDIPTFPAAVGAVLDCLRAPDASAASVAAALATDPGLSVRVLRTVNSAAYSPRREVENLSHAVVMMGLSNVESLVFAVAARDVLPKKVCAGFGPTHFWMTAARRAAVAQALAGRHHASTRSESFTAGLLQDMAVPLIGASRPGAYAPLLERFLHDGQDLAAMERDAFGFDHAEIGGWLCDEWELPAGLRDAVAGHHAPPGEVEGCPPSVAFVAGLHGFDEPTGVDEVVAAVVAYYGVSEEETAALVTAALSSAGELARLFAS